MPGVAASAVTVPANGEGTSIVALSDITSASPCPRTTASPGRTSQRTSSTSIKPFADGGERKVHDLSPFGSVFSVSMVFRAAAIDALTDQ